MFTVLITATLILCLSLIAFQVATCSHHHYSQGNEFHPLPLPLHFALLVAIVEVCWDRPIAIHRSRMAVVERCEARRAEDRRVALAACKASHPSMTMRAAEPVLTF
jgi:hypothetical protein